MKRALVLFLLFAVVCLPLVMAGGSQSKGGSGTKTIGYYMDAADDYYKAGFEVWNELASREGWRVYDVVGQGTAPEQLNNVQNFITQKVDAIVVVQNNPDTSRQCIALARQANIPIFFLTHNPPNVPGLSGFSGYDWVLTGEYAGRSALAHGKSRIINIEGKLGQGTAAGQSEGFIKAFRDAGKDVGDAGHVGGRGGRDLQMWWGSGDWFADPAKRVMQDYITSLGPNGFDGAYVQNDEMMDGAIQALQEAGLNPANYWLGSSNGKEKSWRWVADGWTTMDVNQTPTLEADLGFQQVKAHFEGKPYKKFVYSNLIPFERGTLDASRLVPYEKNEYFRRRDAGIFVYDLANPIFREQPGYR
jgi:ABC-type sugar transport system substrate-binding protein